ncbi:hypothetical protein CBR_g2762 [Chara braunii]|uniref:Reverse transcriptase domain-containing protein n=1 Tax=Chara braunii TaxID=69332 RepID=A0A388KDS6_CHABU|nr:hypothetical protein CBR_g2762 [Chara braunii]|eukprot:GBG68210.1 hypothetical protein CBR_g2762 [Chara braunii]
MVWAAERERRMGDWDKMQVEKQQRWVQTLKVKGVETNDKVSKESFQKLKPRRAQQQMMELRHPFDDAAPIACTAVGILKYANLYYEDILRTRRPNEEVDTDLSQQSNMWEDTSVQLSTAAKLDMDRPVTLEELTQTVKTMAQGKSPGVDGLTVEFYSANWGVFGPLLVELYNEVLVGGRLGKGMTHRVITLLFKKGDKSVVKNWRPISLLNVSYKILVKSLTRRLSKHLPKLVEKDQGAFVQGRSIFNNIVTAIETLEIVQSEGLDIAVLLLDLEKAYDKMEVLLNRVRRNPDIRGLPLHNGEECTVKALADDLFAVMGKVITEYEIIRDPIDPRIGNLKFGLHPEAEAKYVRTIKVFTDKEHLTEDLVNNNHPWCKGCNRYVRSPEECLCTEGGTDNDLAKPVRASPLAGQGSASLGKGTIPTPGPFPPTRSNPGVPRSKSPSPQDKGQSSNSFQWLNPHLQSPHEGGRGQQGQSRGKPQSQGRGKSHPDKTTHNPSVAGPSAVTPAQILKVPIDNSRLKWVQKVQQWKDPNFQSSAKDGSTSSSGMNASSGDNKSPKGPQAPGNSPAAPNAWGGGSGSVTTPGSNVPGLDTAMVMDMNFRYDTIKRTRPLDFDDNHSESPRPSGSQQTGQNSRKESSVAIPLIFKSTNQGPCLLLQINEHGGYNIAYSSLQSPPDPVTMLKLGMGLVHNRFAVRPIPSQPLLNFSKVGASGKIYTLHALCLNATAIPDVDPAKAGKGFYWAPLSWFKASSGERMIPVLGDDIRGELITEINEMLQSELKLFSRHFAELIRTPWDQAVIQDAIGRAKVASAKTVPGAIQPKAPSAAADGV